MLNYLAHEYANGRRERSKVNNTTALIDRLNK